MKIAFISYEYPPDTARGGIATYTYLASKLMVERGHYVEVFCGSLEKNCTENVENIFVTKVVGRDIEFSKNILPFFIERHQLIDFDVVESPEFQTDALHIQQTYPKLPIVVKLHTPWYLIKKLNNSYLTFWDKLKFIVGGLRKANISTPFWIYNKVNDPEYYFTKNSTLILTPSVSLGDIVSTKWKIKRQKILDIPNVYVPNQALLNISGIPQHFTVLFIGRLEYRKGVHLFAKIIPMVLKLNRTIKFLFVGKTEYYPLLGITMKEYLLENCKEYSNSIEFIDKVEYEHIPEIYKKASVCVFPSLWENFPNVCLEAMSAGRAIIGSCEGGMVDMLTNPNCGIIKKPNDLVGIANEIVLLANNPQKCIEIGTMARNAILEKYNGDKVGKMMEDAYTIAIKRNAEYL